MAKSPEVPKVAEMLTDVTKMVSALDPAKAVDELKNLFGQMKIPGIDSDAFVAAQKRNLEAVTAANRAAFEGFQAITRRQVETFQETINEATRAVKDLGAKPSAPEAVARQADLAKQMFERTIASTKEIVEIASKATQDVANIMNTRLDASVQELKEVLQKPMK
ncbi:MAG: phasin family protein [Defluviicoccus sp.]